VRQSRLGSCVGLTDSYVVWLDCRRDPANLDIVAFQASSLDDDMRWPNTQIGTAIWTRTNEWVYPVSTDGRDSAIDQTGIGETDIFTNVEPLSHRRWAAAAEGPPHYVTASDQHSMIFAAPSVWRPPGLAICVLTGAVDGV
jgi:hypothetical protein